MTRSLCFIAAMLMLVNPPAHAQYASHATVAYASADTTYSRDRGAGARKGALWGAGIGAGIGLLGALTGDACINNGSAAGTHCEKLSGTGGGIIVGISTALGTILGAAVGAIIGTEKVHVESRARLTVRFTPTRGQMRLAF